MSTLTPKDHAEAIALFRSEIVGALTRRELDRGELALALTELSQQRFRPPRASSTKTFSVPTLERWYYAYKSRGLEALRPSPRSDRGRCRELTEAQRMLLAAIREEHPSASVPVILRTLVAEGRLQAGAISASSVRRFYQERGLDRVSLRGGNSGRGKVRLRWQAERPGALWHADVCHGAAIMVQGKSHPVRIHGILDDASRYVLALAAGYTERESDMLQLMVKAVRKHGPPDALYLDNGSTYRGQTLSLACARMGTALIHAKPYDAPARGKMERFWRTLREGCLDFVGSLGSLHDLNVRLWAFVDTHYHCAPHAGLMGKSPASVYEDTPRPIDAFDEAMLRKALTVQVRRRVRRDSTLPMDGTDWQTDLHFLAGRVVTVSQCLVEASEPPWIEHEGKEHRLHPVDAKANAHKPRTTVALPARSGMRFDPPKALLNQALGKPQSDEEASS
ncbi:MAG TPA: DDE-type integrase/transposase/recombinase [Polyangiaceae bacterium]|nr:DDE-type integrase/transposase/recombinase [Polyangiaceae bacterium]